VIVTLVRVRANVLLKIKPRYFQAFFGHRIKSPKRVRFKEEGLKFLIDLEKKNISDFSYFILSPNWSKKEKIML